jgi:hypothetical protein
MARDSLVFEVEGYVFSVVGLKGYFMYDDIPRLEELNKLDEEVTLAPECMVKWK